MQRPPFADLPVNLSYPSPQHSPCSVAVFVVRAQPPHVGHVAVIERALRLANRVLVVIGSAGVHCSVDNPFDEREREDMLRQVMGHDPRISYASLEDVPETDRWCRRVQEEAARCCQEHRLSSAQVALVGSSQDGTSYYPQLFPLWRLIDVAPVPARPGRDIRHCLFGGHLDPWLDVDVVAGLIRQELPTWLDLPAAVRARLDRFVGSPRWQTLATVYQEQLRMTMDETVTSQQPSMAAMRRC